MRSNIQDPPFVYFFHVYLFLLMYTVMPVIFPSSSTDHDGERQNDAGSSQYRTERLPGLVCV